MKLRPSPFSPRYYAPSLDKFIRKWESDGVPFLARRYTNPLDGETMWACYVYLPHAGHVVEVVSEKVACKHESLFSKLEDESCPEAVYVGRSVHMMSTMFAAMGGSHHNSRGLPDLLVVKLSAPSARPRALLDYVQEYGTLAVEHNVTHVGHGKDACNFVTMRFRKCTFSDDDTCNDDGYDWKVDLQLVNNPLAKVGKYTVDDYEK